jgi:S-(hydroxymethyl)glutathione dehydrogenase / alcohol dehydrogenase
MWDRMGRSFTAAILTRLNAPLELDEISLPDTLAAGQVLVRIEWSGICGSQLGEIAGNKGEDKFLPHLLGHEGSGRVEATGPGVRHVREGDKVVLHWMKGVGIDSEPPKYQRRGQTINAGWVTTFNQYAVVSENRLTKVPDDTDPVDAALFGCAVTTGFGVVVNNAGLRLGESIVVLGAGGVGLNQIQAAAMTGGLPIVAVDRFPNRLELARRLGATHTMLADKGEADAALEEKLRAVVGAAGADVVVDNTGVPKMIELAYRLSRNDGRVILVGVPPKGANTTLYTLPLHFGKQLTGSHGGDTVPQRDIPRYLGLARAGRYELAPLVSARFPLSKINEALDQIREGRIDGRCVLDCR